MMRLILESPLLMMKRIQIYLPFIKTGVPNTHSDMSLKVNYESPMEANQSAAKQAESSNKHPSSKVSNNHPSSNIIDNPKEGVTTRGNNKANYLEMINNISFTSSIKSKNVNEALENEC